MVYYKVLGRETCPYCCRACSVLKQNKINFMFGEMGSSPELIEHYKEKYNFPTVPIVIRIEGDEEKLIGGYTDMMDHLEKQDDTEISDDSCQLK